MMHRRTSAVSQSSAHTLHRPPLATTYASYVDRDSEGISLDDLEHDVTERSTLGLNEADLSHDGQEISLCFDELEHHDTERSAPGSSEARPLHQDTGKRKKMPPTRGWKIPSLILGSYLLAFTFAMLHYMLFKLLHGQVITAPYGLRQSRVSAISLLFVTAFRAAIIIVIGVCYTQHLWHVLRTTPLKVSLIEEIFQAMANPLKLTNPNFLRYAPLLFWAAAVSWMVPIATIYPPGALTVHNERHLFLQNVNGPIFNPSPREGQLDYGDRSLAQWSIQDDGQSGSNSSLSYDSPISNTTSLTRFLMTSGAGPPIRRLGTDNSSYTITFQGPRIICEPRFENVTMMLEEPKTSISPYLLASPLLDVFNKVPNSDTNEATVALKMEVNKVIGFQLGDPTVLVVERRSLTCEAYTATYTTAVTYTSGAQILTFTTTDLEPFQFSKDREWKPEMESYEDWQRGNAEWFHRANSFAILEAVLSEFRWDQSITYTFDADVVSSDCGIVGPYRISDDTEVELNNCFVMSTAQSLSTVPQVTLLQNSVFNTDRFATLAGHPTFEGPRTLNITEASVNQLLFNVSVSALTLNLWNDSIEVTDFVFENVYQFSQPLRLFLPYGLCLVITLFFVAVGIEALRKNGVPAAGSGFLQVFMTTTGDTAMRRAAVTGCLGGEDNIPEELKDMKVRFGELIEERGAGIVRKAGFGTVEETLPLNKGVAYGYEIAA